MTGNTSAVRCYLPAALTSKQVHALFVVSLNGFSPGLAVLQATSVSGIDGIFFEMAVVEPDKYRLVPLAVNGRYCTPLKEKIP